MAARFPTEQASQPELHVIAKEIPADKIDVLASTYLGIDDTALTHIRDEAAYNSLRTNFKCLLHWCRNTEDHNPREVLLDKLSKAAKEGLVSKKGVDILKQHDQSQDTREGKDKCIILVFRRRTIDF